jgi:hypothetical protein
MTQFDIDADLEFARLYQCEWLRRIDNLASLADYDRDLACMDIDPILREAFEAGRKMAPKPAPATAEGAEDARECDAYPAARERCEGHICPCPRCHGGAVRIKKASE